MVRHYRLVGEFQVVRLSGTLRRFSVFQLPGEAPVFRLAEEVPDLRELQFPGLAVNRCR